MLRTETEARRCWCPFAISLRQNSDSMTGVNRDGNKSDPRSRCLASECMAWRKQESKTFSYKAEAEFRRSGQRLESDEGYCGLAGSPTPPTEG